jgi:hypothetical protein
VPHVQALPGLYLPEGPGILVMDSTTLVAFLLYVSSHPSSYYKSLGSLLLSDCPVPALTVELLGSWDNFTRPYQLKRDSRRSPDTWTGCFTFHNIVCDGDLSDTSNKREGALKQAGTYWYYVS